MCCNPTNGRVEFVDDGHRYRNLHKGHSHILWVSSLPRIKSNGPMELKIDVMSWLSRVLEYYFTFTERDVCRCKNKKPSKPLGWKINGSTKKLF